MSDMESGTENGPAAEDLPADLAKDVGVEPADPGIDPPSPAGQERIAGLVPSAPPVDEEPVPEGVREAEKGTDPSS